MDDFDWIIHRLGEAGLESGQGSVIPPLHQTTMQYFDTVAEMRNAVADEMGNAFYGRGNNQTVALVAEKLAALEGAEAGLMFGSGTAAISSAVLSVLGAGDHVVCTKSPYSWTGKLFTQFLPRFGIETSFASGTSTDDYARVCRDNTKMILVESPSYMNFAQHDLSGIAKIGQDRNITTLCDNSYATPLQQRPLDIGFDFVAHSATKYLNGHSDLVAGFLGGTEAAIRRVFNGPYMTLGATLGPFEAWLLLRGLRTLPLRLERAQRTTLKLIDSLRADQRIRAVHSADPDSGPHSGLFSLELATDDKAVTERFCEALQRFRIATSWGGFESLVYPMCALDGSENYASHGYPPGFVRISVGIEDEAVLSSDLQQALDEAFS